MAGELRSHKNSLLFGNTAAIVGVNQSLNFDKYRQFVTSYLFSLRVCGISKLLSDVSSAVKIFSPSRLSRQLLKASFWGLLRT